MPESDIVMLSSSKDSAYRQLCGWCSNAQAAAAFGLNGFEQHRFEPVQVLDCAGDPHEFHFRTTLFGPDVALNASEIRNGFRSGYEFQVIGDPEEDPMILLGRLLEKIRRALSVKHLVPEVYGLRIAEHGVVRGIIEWDDDEDGLLPLLNVDGRKVTWDELGRMLMTYEGWQFKLEIRDKSEEV